MFVGMMGRKIGMTQVFNEDGKVIPLTILSVGPCQILDTKVYKNHSSLVIGYEERVKNLIKPVIGYFEALSKKAGKKITPKVHIQEVKVPDIESFKIGDVLNIDESFEGEKISVIGTSKGKGTQGVMKRHGMHGGPATHGSHFHRKGGSIGGASFPARVWKGKAMSGRMGNEKVTVKNLLVFKVDAEKNLLFIRGAVPGSKRGLVFIKK